MQVFEGPWKVLAIDTLLGHPRLRPGEIVAHKSGNLILNCPACNAMQFTAATLYNAKAQPTLSKSVLCGAGRCKKCAIRFTIENGRTRLVKKEEEPTVVMDQETREKLASAGVTAAPNLDDAISKAREELAARSKA